MAQFQGYQFTGVRFVGHYSTAFSTIEANYCKSSIFYFRVFVIPACLLFAFTSLVFSGDFDIATHDNESMQVEEHAFEIVNIEWNDFSFKIPVPIGETHSVLISDDIEGEEEITIIIHGENNGYQLFCLSSRSLIKDNGEFYRDMKPLLLLCEAVGGISDIISLTLQAKSFISKEFRRVAKVCSLDKALIYQSETLCDYEQFTRTLLIAIGIMEHMQHSYYFLCINVNADVDDGWDKFLAWNERLAELQ